VLVTLIGVFLLVYGLWYPLKGNVWDYLAVTGTIYLASVSTMLIACCYWKRANNWGAAAAIIVGAVIPVSYLVLEKLPATADFAKEQIGPYYSGIAAFVGTAVAMVIGSLLKPNGTEPIGSGTEQNGSGTERISSGTEQQQGPMAERREPAARPLAGGEA
jgi:Na+/proline symporter